MKQAIIDFSNLACTCWYPAVAAQEAGEKAKNDHMAGCPACQKTLLGDPTECPTLNQIPTYDAKKVLKTNLILKLETLKEAIGVDPTKWIFVKDGRDNKKYELFPGYKGNRDPNRVDCRPMAEHYLRDEILVPDAKWVWSPVHEADDTIAALASMFSAMGNEVVIVSSDRDMWQLLSHKNVSVYSPGQKAWVGEEQIYKAFGLRDPLFIALHKSLWGDTSDNVKNLVPRMQKWLIPVIEETDGTLEDFWVHAKRAVISDRCRELLFSNAAGISVNYTLVKLSEEDVVPVTVDLP